MTVGEVHFPSKGSRVCMGTAHQMRCQIKVYDGGTDELIGPAEVSVSAKMMPGGGVAGGAVGYLMQVGVRASLDNPMVEKMMLYHEMADEIVEVLDRAIKEKSLREPPRNRGPASQPARTIRRCSVGGQCTHAEIGC